MSNLKEQLDRVKALKNGTGIQHLLDEAYKILENPIMMFNTEYSLLAYTNNTNDDPIWNEIMSYGTFSYESQKLFEEEGFVDLVASAKTITFMPSDKLKYNRISGKLFNKDHIHVANLVIVACDRPFNDADPEVFEAVCEVLSKEIIKSEFYQTYGMMYQETYIRKLIDGSIDDKGLYAAHIQIVYDGLKPNLFLAVTDISKCDESSTKLTYFRDLFKQVYPEFKYSIYSNYVIILINLERTSLNVDTDLKELTSLFERNNLYAGVSGCFENLYNLRQHYLEAVSALKDGLSARSGQRIFLHS